MTCVIDRVGPAPHARPTPSCLRFGHHGHALRHAELPTPPVTAAPPGIERFRVEIPHLFRDRRHADPPTVRDRIDAELPTRPQDGAGSRQPSGATAPGVAPKYIRPPARPGESRGSPASGRRIIRGRRGESVHPAQASAGLIPGKRGRLFWALSNEDSGATSLRLAARGSKTLSLGRMTGPRSETGAGRGGRSREAGTRSAHLPVEPENPLTPDPQIPFYERFRI